MPAREPKKELPNRSICQNQKKNIFGLVIIDVFKQGHCMNFMFTYGHGKTLCFILDHSISMTFMLYMKVGSSFVLIE